MDGINVELIQDLQVFAGKIIAGEMTVSIGWYAPLSDYPLMKQNEEAGDYTVELWHGCERCMARRTTAWTVPRGRIRGSGAPGCISRAASRW